MGNRPLSATTLAQVERGMDQAGLRRESKRQEFILWYANTYDEGERGRNSTSDIKQIVLNWMSAHGN